jgi:hypothetical protein
VRPIGIAIAAALGFTWVAPVHADCATDVHLATCIDADTLFSHPGPVTFHFIGARRTTLPGTVGVGFVATYLSRPIVLVLPSVDPRGAEAVAVDHVLDTTLLLSLGLTERVEATLALPVVAYRSGSGLSALTSDRTRPLAHAAMRDARVGAAVRVAGCPGPTCEAPFGAAARFELSLPTGDESSFAGDRSVVAIPSVSGEYAVLPFVVGAELGARVRATSDLAGSRVGSQLVFAAGLGADVLDDRKLGFFLEAFALPTLAAQHDLSVDATTGERVESGSRAALVPAEWEAMVRSADVVTDGMSLSLGAGTPLVFGGESAVTAPKFRVTFALRYAPGRR